MSQIKVQNKMIQQANVPLVRNLFPVDFGSIKKVYRYGVCIEMYKGDGNKRVLSTDDRHDPAISRRLVSAYMKSHKVPAFAYDGAGLLASAKAFDEESVRLSPEQLRSWNIDELASYASIVEGHVQLSFSYASEDYELDMVRDVNKDTFRQFIELVTNQHPLESGAYVKAKNGMLVATEGFEDKEWYRVHKACHKSVLTVQKHRADKKIVAETVVELESSQIMMVAPLRADELVIKFMRSKDYKVSDRINGDELAACAALLKRLGAVMAEYAENGGEVFRPVVENGNYVFKSNPRTIFNLDNKVQQTAEFRAKYPNLKYPNFPAAECGFARNKNPIPLEYLLVKKFQVIPMSKMEELIDSNKRPIIPKPSERHAEIRKHFTGLALTSDKNPTMKSFGLNISETPEKMTTVIGERLSAPNIHFGAKAIDVDSRDHSWKDIGVPFSRPAVIDKIVFGMIVKHPNQKKDLDEFVKKMLTDAAAVGIRILETATVVSDGRTSTHDFLDSLFQGLKEKKNPYVMLLEGIRGRPSDAHGILKAMEMKHDVPVQHVTLFVAGDARTKPQTMRNLLNKVNMKAGGRNYYCIPPEMFNNSPAWLDKTLVIGVDVGHPKVAERNGSTPSVPAFTANIGTSAMEFVGDFALAPAKQEKIDDHVLVRWAKFVIKQWLATGREAPARVFYIRDGVDDGQESKVHGESQAFVSACKQAVKQAKGGELPEMKLVTIVARKRNNVRLFSLANNNQLMNPLPGTSITAGVAAFEKNEFYMYAPNPRIGTANFLRCTVLINELNAPPSILKAILHSLCYLHQLDKSPTSLATPLLLADEMATRGGDIWSYNNRYHNVRKTDEVTWSDLTVKLCYSSNCVRLAARRTV